MRGHGVGRQLLMEVIDLARGLGHSVLTLSMEADHPAVRVHWDSDFWMSTPSVPGTMVHTGW